MHTETIPLALYAHFPWCIKKCPYCDFNSHQLRGAIEQRGYIDALLRDVDADIARGGIAEGAQARKLTSVFFGGGTPSLFDAESFARLLDGLRARFDFDARAEVTLEANPGALEHGAFRAYRDAGVNRISLGVQTFCGENLRALGRIHSAEEARDAITAARAVFENCNIDLMFALPAQTARDALRDLDTAIAFSPRHLSLYQLTIEPHTQFHRRPPTLPDDERAAEMQRALHTRAAEHGYHRYEISAHAQRGGECKHNLHYWQFGDYLGIGAGAHAKFTRNGAITRWQKRKHPQQYLRAVAQGNAVTTRAKLSRADALFEFLMNALRLRDGFTAQLLTTRTAHAMQDALTLLQDARNRGWIEFAHEHARCTDSGYWFLDEILQEILPE